MSRFAIACNLAGRIDAVLYNEDGFLAVDAVGRMAGVLFAPSALPCFYEMLVELEERGVLCGWRLESRGGRSGEPRAYRVSAARDEGTILVVGEGETAPSGDWAGDIRALGELARERVPEGWPGALFERLSERVGDPAAVIEDARIQVRALQHLLHLPEQMERELLRLAAHDLRNPLLVISMSCSFLSEQSQSLSDDERGLLSDALEMCEAISRFFDSIRSLVDFSAGRSTLELDVADIGGLIRQIVERHGISGKKADIRVVEEHLDPMGFEVDADKLLFAVSELVGNAVKFCESGSTVRVSLIERDSEAVIAVADDGPGIAREMQSRLFKPLGRGRSRTGKGDRSGAGIGLAIVRHIAEAHGGRVELESELGRGTRVEIILPAASQGVAASSS